jgi:hypothetical protein
MAKDFFDSDLIERGAAAPANAAAGNARAPDGERSFFERQKHELPEQVGQTSDEIERLRLRQEELERRKQALVEQRRRVEAYERGRRELLEKLGRSAVMVVREGEQAARVAALCSETGAHFQKLHQELEAIAPERWSEAEYDRELTQALAQIEAAGTEYRRALDRINASSWHRAPENDAGSDPLAGVAAGGGVAPHTFTQWLAAGFAFCLPLLALVSVLALVYLLKQG